MLIQTRASILDNDLKICMTTKNMKSITKVTDVQYKVF